MPIEPGLQQFLDRARRQWGEPTGGAEVPTAPTPAAAPAAAPAPTTYRRREPSGFLERALLESPLLPIAGSTAAMIAGSPTLATGLPGLAAEATLGAAGMAAGETLRLAMRKFFLGEVMTPVEAGKKIAGEAVTGAVATPVGRGIGWAARPFLRVAGRGLSLVGIHPSKMLAKALPATKAKLQQAFNAARGENPYAIILKEGTIKAGMAMEELAPAFTNAIKILKIKYDAVLKAGVEKRGAKALIPTESIKTELTAALDEIPEQVVTAGMKKRVASLMALLEKKTISPTALKEAQRGLRLAIPESAWAGNPTGLTGFNVGLDRIVRKAIDKAVPESVELAKRKSAHLFGQDIARTLPAAEMTGRVSAAGVLGTMGVAGAGGFLLGGFPGAAAGTALGAGYGLTMAALQRSPRLATAAAKTLQVAGKATSSRLAKAGARAASIALTRIGLEKGAPMVKKGLTERVARELGVEIPVEPKPAETPTPAEDTFFKESEAPYLSDDGQWQWDWSDKKWRRIDNDQQIRRQAVALALANPKYASHIYTAYEILYPEVFADKKTVSDSLRKDLNAYLRGKDTVEMFYDSAEGLTTGKFVGKAMAFLGRYGFGEGEDEAAYADLSGAYGSFIARFLGEVGVLTDVDRKIALQSIPTLDDTASLIAKKRTAMEGVMARAERRLLQTARLQGVDVTELMGEAEEFTEGEELEGGGLLEQMLGY